MLTNPFEVLADNDLEQNLLTLANGEREVNADIILHLLVVKERKLYAAAGFDSLFSYCTGRLGFSRSTAYRRKAVVDKASDFPLLVEKLREGSLHLCAAAAIAPHLEKESASELLDAVAGLSHREVEAYLVKRWKTKPTAPAIAKASGSNVETATKAELGLMVSTRGTAPVEVLPLRTVVRPISKDTNRVSVTLSDKTIESLKRAKEIIGGKSDDEILLRALERLLDQVAPERRHARREKKGQKRVEKAPKQSSGSGTLSSRRGRLADRDKVIVDGDCRCSFVSKTGQRCDARAFLEIDHVLPWALGGPSTSENQRPLCRTHNAYLAERTFGLKFRASR